MTPEERSHLSYTIGHFQEVARQNRFPENNAVEHDQERCVVCHPELLSLDPFVTYLEVVTQSVKVRRPRLDAGMVNEINGDLALQGSSAHVSLEALLTGDEKALACWVEWTRDALSTGLQLLSIHSNTSHEYSIEEAEEDGFGAVIEEKIRELMAYQKEGASSRPTETASGK